MSGNDSLQRRHLVLCLIVLQWNYWPWVIGRYASDFAWYMSQLILVFYGYCWEICQWFSMVYVSSSFISPRAAVGRYASDFAWYMSQLILVFYGYCWEICQWFSMVYVSSSFISPRAAVGRYASGLPWYMSQCLSIFIVFYHISYVISLSPFISGDRNLRSIF